MAFLVADENFPLPAINHLRQMGHDILTLQQLDMASQGIPDDLVLATANGLKRCLLTLNRKDFIKLHQLNSNHAGIVIATSDTDFIALAERVHTCLSMNQVVAGQLLRVQRPNLA